jgi:potassium efflux system protein
MTRKLGAIFLLAAIHLFAVGAEGLVAISQLEESIENIQRSADPADPVQEKLLQNLYETRSHLLKIEKFEQLTESYRVARENSYAEAERIRAATGEAEAVEAPAIEDSADLAEMEQRIQLAKSDLSVLQKRLSDSSAARSAVSERPGAIRERLGELGQAQPALESNLGLLDKNVAPGSLEEANLWLAESQYQLNRAEKDSLDEELLSQPMRLQLLAAQEAATRSEIDSQDTNLLILEKRAGVLREGEAARVVAEAQTALAGASDKHRVVRELADENTVFSASLAERSAAIQSLRARENDSRSRAERYERDLSTIERKLEILGMEKTVGEILREQAVRLPGRKMLTRELLSIAGLIGESSLRQMDLEDERTQLADLPAFVDSKLLGLESGVATRNADDLLELASSRSVLVARALEIEVTYARALTNLDFAVHREADAVDKYRVFISERLLWVQSQDAFSWALIKGLPGQLKEVFAPRRWLSVMQWVITDTLNRPLVLVLFLAVAGLLYLTPRLRVNLVDTGKNVGFVRTDTYLETVKSLLYTVLMAVRWPLLIMVISIPLAFHESDSGLAAALHDALLTTSFYFLGLEFIRCLMLPGGLVEAHFRWPKARVSSLSRRVVKFERLFLTSTFVAILFFNLYPTEVGGAVGTLAVVALLMSMAHFFFRMPHFVQNKVDMFFSEPKARIHSFWGTLARAILAWSPVAMIVAVLFGYTYSAIELSLFLIDTMVLFIAMLLIHELGMRWLRLTRRRLKLKARDELRQLENSDDSEAHAEEDLLEHDSDLLNDEGTKFLNAVLLFGSLLGAGVIWFDAFPALSILDTIELWQRTESVNGQAVVLYTTLGDVISALAIGLVGWILLRRIPGLLEILLRQRMNIGAASAYAFATVFKYALTTLIVVTILSMLGGSWSQIQWAVAALSLGIGFGLQEIVANFFSGLIILFEQPIRVGDTVTVGDTTGVVTRIQMRATTVRDWDRRELLVPNKEFVTSRLLNWSLTDHITRLHIEVGVAYGSDMDKALEIVRQAALEHPLIIADPAPFVTFDEFGDNALTISLRCYLEELDKRLSTASTIRLAINRDLAEAGISVAFPQRDVHLDAREPLDIRLVNPQSASPDT